MTPKWPKNSMKNLFSGCFGSFFLKEMGLMIWLGARKRQNMNLTPFFNLIAVSQPFEIFCAGSPQSIFYEFTFVTTVLMV
jgi:hypothetical protein